MTSVSLCPLVSLKPYLKTDTWEFISSLKWSGKEEDDTVWMESVPPEERDRTWCSCLHSLGLNPVEGWERCIICLVLIPPPSLPTFFPRSSVFLEALPRDSLALQDYRSRESHLARSVLITGNPAHCTYHSLNRFSKAKPNSEFNHNSYSRHALWSWALLGSYWCSCIR